MFASCFVTLAVILVSDLKKENKKIKNLEYPIVLGSARFSLNFHKNIIITFTPIALRKLLITVSVSGTEDILMTISVPGKENWV